MAKKWPFVLIPIMFSQTLYMMEPHLQNSYVKEVFNMIKTDLLESGKINNIIEQYGIRRVTIRAIRYIQKRNLSCWETTDLTRYLQQHYASKTKKSPPKYSIDPHYLSNIAKKVPIKKTKPTLSPLKIPKNNGPAAIKQEKTTKPSPSIFDRLWSALLKKKEKSLKSIASLQSTESCSPPKTPPMAIPLVIGSYHQRENFNLNYFVPADHPLLQPHNTKYPE